MSVASEFTVNRADLNKLLTHLRLCDSAFTPPLRSRVDIGDYTKKIFENAVRFERLHESVLVGLIAVYCNDPMKTRAFITSVSVLPSFQRNGLAADLMANCLDYLRKEGYSSVELEVDKRSRTAIALYRRHGFTSTLNKGEFSTFMNLSLVNQVTNNQSPLKSSKALI
jgi:ribosomal protein S18 acetylase RimI-like enzyme